MAKRLRFWTGIMLALWVAVPALAFDFIPTRYDDPIPDGCPVDDCSLREAVIAANENLGDDRVLLSAGIYHLALVGNFEDFSGTGDLDLRESVELLGVGASLSVIDATNLGEQAVTTLGNANMVTAFRRLAIRGASADGLRLQTGTHTVEDCEFFANGAATNGHGVSMTISSVATIRRSTFAANAGSGLSVTQGSATIQNSTFTGNGGAEVLISTATAWSCTHCTIADADNAAAEVVVQNSTALLANSIVKGSCSFPAAGALSSLGGNLESPANGCGLTQGSDQHDVAAVTLLLLSLADNGGATRTQAPQSGSAAIGGALDALCLEGDQRGVVRTTDCDSGAVEDSALAVATPLFADGFQQGDSEAWSATAP